MDRSTKVTVFFNNSKLICGESNRFFASSLDGRKCFGYGIHTVQFDLGCGVDLGLNAYRQHYATQDSFFQTLLIPSSITAGLIGMILGPKALGFISWSEHISTYTTVLIAIVFATMPYSMKFDRGVRSGVKIMWAFSTAMFVGQWGLFILLGIYLFEPVWGTEDWFGMMLPVGFVGGFGTAAAVGTSLEAAGAEAAISLGFTSATVGTFAAIVGGIIFTTWGIKKGKTSAMPAQLPWDLRSGYIDKLGERPSIGKASTNPSAIEPLALHAGIIFFTVAIAYAINGWLKELSPLCPFHYLPCPLWWALRAWRSCAC